VRLLLAGRRRATLLPGFRQVHGGNYHHSRWAASAWTPCVGPPAAAG